VSDLQTKAQIEKLERRLADLKARMPAHSIPPSMMIVLDELEDQLAELQAGEKKKE
jgi:polyhydroxyalkanoate synthesis regulator phasin